MKVNVSNFAYHELLNMSEYTNMPVSDMLDSIILFHAFNVFSGVKMMSESKSNNVDVSVDEMPF